jgi:hypothetical protein
VPGCSTRLPARIVIVPAADVQRRALPEHDVLRAEVERAPLTTGHCLPSKKHVLPCIEVQRPFALLTGAHAAPAERANSSAASAMTGKGRRITA